MADGEKTGAATRLIKSVAPLTSTLAKVLRGAPTMVHDRLYRISPQPSALKLVRGG